MTTNPSHEQWSSKRVFTTGEAAQVCGVSQQTIIRSFDRGRLQGFRVPGSKFRRIPREELVRFMRSNGIPLDTIEAGPKRVLVIDPSPEAARAAETATREDDGIDVRLAASAFEAGFELAEFVPQLVVVDPRAPGLDWAALCRRTQAAQPRPALAVLETAGLVGAADRADAVLSPPLTGAALRDACARLLAIDAGAGASTTE